LDTVIDIYELTGRLWQDWNDSLSILDDEGFISRGGYRKGSKVMPSGRGDIYAGGKLV